MGHHQKITVPFNLPSQLNPTLVIKQTQHANSTFSRSKKHSRDYCTISSTVLNSVPELKTLFFSFQLRLFEPRFIYIEPFLSVRRRRIAGNRKEADLTIPRKPRIRMRSLPSCQEAKSTGVPDTVVDYILDYWIWLTCSSVGRLGQPESFQELAF